MPQGLLAGAPSVSPFPIGAWEWQVQSGHVTYASAEGHVSAYSWNRLSRLSVALIALY